MVSVTSEHLIHPARKMPSLFSQWKEDVTCVFARDPAAHSIREILLTYPGVHAVLFHRLSHRLWRNNWKFTARIVASIARMLTNVDIHPGATVGKRFAIRKLDKLKNCYR